VTKPKIKFYIARNKMCRNLKRFGFGARLAHEFALSDEFTVRRQQVFFASELIHALLNLTTILKRSEDDNTPVTGKRCKRAKAMKTQTIIATNTTV
jgi:hypothetical protein